VKVEVDVIGPDAQMEDVGLKRLDGWQRCDHLPQHYPRYSDEAIEVSHRLRDLPLPSV
jgi:hypothetical protein